VLSPIHGRTMPPLKLKPLGNMLGEHFPPVKNEGYLAIGDTVYSLTSVKDKTLTNIIDLAKQSGVEQAKIQADTLMKNAHLSVAALIQDARDKRQEATRLLDQAKSKNPPPAWAMCAPIGIPIQFKNGMWEVQFVIDLVLKHFDTYYGSFPKLHYVFDALPLQPTKIAMWVPIDTKVDYSVSSIYVDQNFPTLPHMDHEASCMSMGDNPTKITSINQLTMLKGSVTRCLSRVNLSSLRGGPEDWVKNFSSAIPADLLAAFLQKKEPWSSAVLKLVDGKGIEKEKDKVWLAAQAPLIEVGI
jgi:hypothetical protein